VLDSSLPALLSTGTIPIITHLISYSLPTNKSTFKSRLSLLLPSLSSHFTPSLSILLTLQCFNQSHAILKLCERLQTEPPPQLVAMGTKRQNEIRRNNPLWGVCHQIKCYGNCRKVDCIHVHLFEELSDIRPSKLSPALVPTDGVVKVLVKTVASPCHLWVQIIDHTPLHRGQTPYRPPTLTLSQISMDLGFYYSEPSNRMLCGQPSVGDYLCLNSVSGTYYRALVLDFSQPLGLYFHHKEKAKVRLVDTGEECIVDVNQLYTLPLSFLETPPLVIEAFLCGLIPPDNDTDWPPP
ncbi:PREDICTED: putative ATP-dependent RNA helicase TDRD12, partial [Amphimedon queenslandica]